VTLAIVQAIGTAAAGASSQPGTNWAAAPTDGNLLLALGYIRNQFAPSPINGWRVFQSGSTANWTPVLYYKYALGSPQVENIDRNGFQEWALSLWEVSAASGLQAAINAVTFGGQNSGGSSLNNGPVTTRTTTSLALSGYSGQFPGSGGGTTFGWSVGWTVDVGFVSPTNDAYGDRNWAAGGHQAVTGGAAVSSTLTTSIATITWTNAVVELSEVTPPNVRVSAAARETLLTLPSNVRVSAAVRETLHSNPANVRVSAIVRETLVSFPTVPNFGAASGRATVQGVTASITLGLISGHSSVHGHTPSNMPVAGSIVGRSRVSGIAQPTKPQASQFPFPTLQNQIKSYLYVWCNDDDNLQSMVAAYNAYTQAYLDWFNSIYLPIYTNGTISGTLLDWVATYLYGIARPGLPEHGKPGRGPFNTYTLNSLVFNGGKPGTPGLFFVTSDDYYKRILTWLFYKGDGKVFNVRWLKRRVERFLYGLNGIDPGVVTTYDVSVVFTGRTAVTISVPPSDAATILQAAVQAGVLELPFQITWTVTT
jgi:hypothetical protein